MRLENLTVGDRREAKREGLIHKRSSSSTVPRALLRPQEKGGGAAGPSQLPINFLQRRPGPSYRLDEIERLAREAAQGGPGLS